MSFVNPFAPKPRAGDAEVARVKRLVRATLGLADDVGVTVSEIACRDAACRGLETAILVMAPAGPTRLLRIGAAMTAVTAEAVAAAAAAAPAPDR